MIKEKSNQKDRPLHFILLSVFFKLAGGLAIVALSIMCGNFIFCVSTMFDFMSGFGHIHRMPVVSAEKPLEIRRDFKPSSSNKVFTLPQAASPPASGKVNEEDFNTLKSAWENNETYKNMDQDDPLNEPLSPREQEIQLLRKALPENSLIPGKRSEQELTGYLKSIEEQQDIQNLINKKKATVNDLRRYYELQAKRFEDEIELIDFCQRIVSGKYSDRDTSLPFCTAVVMEGEAKRAANEQSLEELRQSLL